MRRLLSLNRAVCAFPRMQTSSAASPTFSSAPLALSTLTSVSSVDGRYATTTAPLRNYLSEFALIRGRVLVEIRWLQLMSRTPQIPEVPELPKEAHQFLDSIIDNFSVADAERVKEIEAKIRHDVKAVEYFIKERLTGQLVLPSKSYVLPSQIPPADLSKLSEWIHFACTSEDISNLSYAVSLSAMRHAVLIPTIQSVIDDLRDKAHAVCIRYVCHRVFSLVISVGRSADAFPYSWPTCYSHNCRQGVCQLCLTSRGLYHALRHVEPWSLINHFPGCSCTSHLNPNRWQVQWCSR